MPGKLLGEAVPDDGGYVCYREPGGNLVLTDKSKHMLQQDPRSGKLQVFEKIEGTRPATAGDLAQAGLDILKRIPFIGSAIQLPDAADDFWSGKPGAIPHMSDVLTGLGVTGSMGAIRPGPVVAIERPSLEHPELSPRGEPAVPPPLGQAAEAARLGDSTAIPDSLIGSNERSNLLDQGARARALASADNGQLSSSELSSVLQSAPAEYANARAAFLQSKLPDVTRGNVTIGVGIVEDPQGVRSVLIGTSEPRVSKPYLRPQLMSFIRSNETRVSGLKHAEINILDHAKANGLKVVAVGAGNGYCADCVKAIAYADGLATGRRRQ